MRLVDIIFGSIMTVLGASCFIEAHRVWNGWGGTGTMPVIVGTIFALLSALILATPSRALSEVQAIDRKEIFSVLFIAVSFALYIFIMNWIGYFLSTWLFLAVVTKYMSRDRLPIIIIWTGVVAITTDIVFREYLGLYLPRGFILK